MKHKPTHDIKYWEDNSRPEKRTFILLLLLTCVVLVGAAVLVWVIPFVGFANINPHLPLIMAILIALIVLFLIGGGLTLVFTIIRGKNLFFNRRIRGVVIRFLFPGIGWKVCGNRRGPCEEILYSYQQPTGCCRGPAGHPG